MSAPEWLDKWVITGTWQQHRARGSAGGIDYGAPRGTPIYAPSDGDVDYRRLGDGSSVARVRRPDGTATEFLHGVPHGEARPVRAGDLIATSDGRRGVWGAGPSTGPHIHVHDVDDDGQRVYPFSTITSTARRKARDMLLFHTADKSAPRGIRYHIITADGREAQFTSGGTEFPNGIAGQLGSSVATDRALLDALKRQLRDSVPPAGAVTLDVAAIVDELAKRLKA